MKVLVTGGAGFIGSAVIRHLIANTDYSVICLDKLTYAGNMNSVSSVRGSKRFHFRRVDICDRAELDIVFSEFNPDVVMHLAAESHVDRSIEDPKEFVESNIVGTFQLLEAARRYWSMLSPVKQSQFRFHHVSTDEVYGDLKDTDDLFRETTPYAPSSPYSASKASSDHLVRAWHHTYGLPVVLTNCSNNYGPYHFPEKFIPHMILNALTGKGLPVYGSGNQIRDWLFVEDHARALVLVATSASIGETYNIGGNSEKKNIEVVHLLCSLLDELRPQKPNGIASYTDLITFVEDRPGHDLRYGIDTSKIKRELGWKPRESFETGLRKTVVWYLDNQEWWQSVLDNGYRLSRLG